MTTNDNNDDDSAEVYEFLSNVVQTNIDLPPESIDSDDDTRTGDKKHQDKLIVDFVMKNGEIIRRELEWEAYEWLFYYLGVDHPELGRKIKVVPMRLTGSENLR